ncbi:MAG: GGDEF domain-containing protein [Candidatus Omnitrophica bacterium]|nr:GGDEF domain-containing protein [Candidatus Omnitrophota bacterium]
MPGGLFNVHSRHFRRTLIACLLTLGLSAGLLGTVAFMRWRSDHAMRKDTRIVLTEASQQLLRALQSRRGTLTLLRDTLDRSKPLGLDDRRALSNSAVAHTRHLLGIGFARSAEPLTWWTTPTPTTRSEGQALSQDISQRLRLRDAWRVPSTFTVSHRADRPLLVMVEPLRSRANRRSAVAGVFDLKPLLNDFFELTLQQPFPAQLLRDDEVLYRSAGWQASTAQRRPPIIEEAIRLDAVRWTLQMQPGITQTARTISWFNILLVILCAFSAIAVSAIIWLLAMRTRLLQHAVSRRTAALRRTMERLRQLATTDELTGLWNRRAFLERWEFEYTRAKRYERPLGCLLIDVDGFKLINDTAGHPMGDVVLKRVAQALTESLRQSDVLARFGGDEFIAALPETSVAQASLVADKLRHLAIRGPWERTPDLGPIRLSVGVGFLQPHLTAEQVIQRADAEMYASRRTRQAQPAKASVSSDILV